MKKYLKFFFSIIFFSICCFGFTQNNNMQDINCKTEIIFNIDYPYNGEISTKEKIQFLYKKNKKKYSELNFKLTLTPAAISQNIGTKLAYLNFANFYFNFMIASGWNYNRFYGLAANKNIGNKEFIKPYNFSKVLLKFNFAVELFLNLNFFAQNEWSDLRFSTIQFLNYQTLLPKEKNEFWYFKNDKGINREGFIYKATYSIEYSMPLYLNKIKIDFTTKKRLYKPIPNTLNLAEKLWDIDIEFNSFFKPNDIVTIKLSSLFGTEPNYLTLNPNLYFTEQYLNYKKPQIFYFKKISAGIILNI